MKVNGKNSTKGTIRANNKCQYENPYKAFLAISNFHDNSYIVQSSHLLGLVTTAEKLGLSKPFIYLDKSFTIRYCLINKKNISWYKDAQGTCLNFVTDFPVSMHW